ncbi:penicillin acylase family protein [Massilia endophytica]|uniref:penicillin acylase family protein n=1 Tax=Massilia endophytica TaxID=2899220 RepID=UPI001E3321A8|nr:penicillin acylase family protein [Massilia endophytica]UGQ49066.1 penicillin acylase family protein [Massilia endophytica]
MGAGRWIKRIAVGVVALLLLAVLALWFFLRGSLAQLDGKVTSAGLHGRVTVQRDDMGVPTVAGGNRLDVAYATGFVHAQDRFFQMDLLRRVAAGELAELFGAKALPLDRAHRLHRFRARAARALAALDPAGRELLQRYAAGVNDGVNALGTRPFEYALIGMAPRAWSADDSLLVIWAMYFDLQGSLEGRELARGWLRDHSTPEQLAFLLPEASRWDAPLDADGITAAPAPLPDSAPEWWGEPAPHDPDTVAASAWAGSVGSNNWAIAGSRSATGGAIVANDMHLGIKLPNTWYRMVLQIPEGSGGTRRVVGVTLPGAPVVVVGSNGRVAWSFTNSYGDHLDLIPANSDPSRPGHVELNGRWETPVRHAETILVKGEPAHTMQVSETSLGPIRESLSGRYAVHWIAHEPGLLNVKLTGLEHANSVDEALSIAQRSGIPAQNFVAGDASGQIGWTIAGPVPQRARPGVASTFPLKDAGDGWTGALPPAQVPVVRNPASGQLNTANSRQLAGSGAELLGDGGYDIGARTRQARDALLALGARSTERSVYGVMLDDRALFIDGWRQRALAVLDAQALEGQPRRAEAAKLLREQWGGRASVDSASYRFARAYMWSVYELLYGAANAELAKLGEGANAAAANRRWQAVVERLLDEQPAAWLPKRYASWRDFQLAAIDLTIADLGPNGAPLAAATWGQRNTAGIAHPIANAVPALRKWLSAPADQLPGDSHMPRVSGRGFGQSERLTVSPGKEEQGLFDMPGGQSGHPLSPFFLAGHAEWVRGTPLPLLPGAARHTLVFSN